MEVETKYTVPGRKAFKRLLKLAELGAYELRPAEAQRLADHYLDTADRAVLRSGYALRLRESLPAEAEPGGEAGQASPAAQWRGTLKSLGGAPPSPQPQPGQGNGAQRASAAGPGAPAVSAPAESYALHQREEHEVAVPPGALPEAWPPGPARDLALRLSGGQPLSPLFALRQVRHRRAVWHGDREVAELSLDEVELDGPEAADGSAETTYELEIELAGAGAVADLAALDEALRSGDYGLTPQPQSKFERALARVLAAEPPRTPGVSADDGMAAAGRKVLRFHFGRMLRHEPGARAGEDIEAVHDMRVATRRQRAALRLFAPYFKRKALRPVRAGLKAVAGRLGAVRDLDVQLAAARAYQAGLPAAEAAALEPLLAAWHADREAARAELLHHLDSRTFRKFKKAYAAFLEDEGAGVRDPAGAVPVRQALPAALWQHFAAVRAYEDVPGGLEAAPVAVLHALRIEAKRLRYALEFFAEALPPAAEPASRAIVELQDHLGELNDAEVTAARLAGFLSGDDLPPETRAAADAYRRERQARQQALHQGVGAPWKKAAGKKFRRALGDITGDL